MAMLHAGQHLRVVAERGVADELGQLRESRLAQVEHFAPPHLIVLFAVVVQVQASEYAAPTAWHGAYDRARIQQHKGTVSGTAGFTVRGDAAPNQLSVRATILLVAAHDSAAQQA